jgi:acyl-CoA thioesterase
VPSDTSSFEEITRIERLGAGRHRASCDASWMQGRGLYGGLAAALLARALEAEAATGQRIARMTTSFVAPFPPGECTINTTSVRRGRNVSAVRAELVSSLSGETIATCLATLARPRASAALVHRALALPLIPLPDHVSDGPAELYLPTFASHFELRQCVGPRSFSGGAEARVGGWCRMRAPGPLDAARLVAILDAWPPAAVGVSPGWCPVASLEMTVHFLVPLPPEREAASDWLFFEARCDHAEGGLADERAVIFDARGTPLATAQQLVALLPAPENAPLPPTG